MLRQSLFLCSLIVSQVAGDLSAQMPDRATAWLGATASANTGQTVRPGISMMRTPSARTISVDLKKVPIADALRQVAQSADVGMVYANDVLPKRKMVSFQATDISPLDAVNAILDGTKLVARMESNGRITIVPSQRAEDKGDIRGKVVRQDNKQPIANIDISVNGTNIRTRTNEQGEFTLRGIATGEVTLLARGVGFVRGTQKVTVSATEVATISFELEQTVSSLDEIVVTSSRVEQSAREIPVMVTSVSAEEIRRRGITRVDQLLNGSIPGIYIPDAGPATRNPGQSADFTVQTTPAVRGQNFISSGATTPGNLKIYVDGVELPSYAALTQIDINTIETFDAVAGPAATAMYGSGASDGVISITTKRGIAGSAPQWMLDVKSVIFQSPYKTNPVISPAANLTLNGGSAEVGYSLGASYEYEGAWVPDYKSTKRSVNGGLSWTHAPLLINVTGMYSGPNKYNSATGTWLQEGIRDGRFARARVPVAALVPDERGSKFEQKIISASANYNLWPNWSHQLTLGVSDQSTKNVDFGPSFVNISDTLLSRSTSDGTRTTLNYRTYLTVGDKNRIESLFLFGIDYSGTTSSFSTVSNIARPDDANFSSYVTLDQGRNTGYWGRWNLALYNTVFLNSGLRIERNPAYGSDVFGSVAPQAGISIPIDFSGSTVRLFAAYGKASNPPTSSMKDASFTSSSVSGDYLNITENLSNPNLKPKVQSALDYGIEFLLGQRVWLVVNAYNQYGYYDPYRQTLTVDTVPGGPSDPTPYKIITSRRYLNSGKMQTIGAEVKGSFSWEAWDISSRYSAPTNIIRSIPPDVGITATYGDALRVGDRLPYLPTYNWYTSIQRAVSSWHANVEIVSVGRHQANDQVDALSRSYGTPEYEGPSRPGRSIMMGKKTDFNLNLSRRFTPAITLALGVENVGNNMALKGMDTRTPKAGRVSTVRFTYRF